MNLRWVDFQSKQFFLRVELISVQLSSLKRQEQPVAVLHFPQESNLLASAQNHPCDERRERGKESREEEKEEEEEEERATDVSGDVQRSRRTSGTAFMLQPTPTIQPGGLDSRNILTPYFES